MSLLRHLDLCNRFDPDGFLPLMTPQGRLGLIRRDYASLLAGHPRLFEISDRAVVLQAGDPEAITAGIAGIGAGLVARGLVAGLRGEDFSASLDWGGPVLFRLDRALVPFFGIRGYGVHLNGFRSGGAELWVGRRAADKKVAPDKLDNLVAGGISAGYSAFDTLIKEAGEEAGMEPDLARRAHPVGAIPYRFEVPEGVRNDVLFVYDLETPADFKPRNVDGEFAEFMVMPPAEALRLVAQTDAFKFNVTLVIIDFAIRHGLIGPDHPEYLALVRGLGGGMIRGG